MCGIVGLLAFGKLNKKQEMTRQAMMRYISTELLIETEDRGKDATGAAILFDDGEWTGIKRGEESSSWLAKIGKAETSYGSFTEVWKSYEQCGPDPLNPKYTPVKVFIGHCRKGTTGDKEDNTNNHPIKIKNIVGIHNGVIRNDDIIAKRLGCKRDGKVDSEMIFRLFDYYTNEGKEPFTMDIMTNIIDRLTGAFAVVAFNADNPFQVPVFRDGRPIEMVLIKEYGLLVLVSEEKFWTKVHFRYERAVTYGDLKLPSLVGSKPSIATFGDCNAAIFDLTVQCTSDTKMDDLGQIQRVPRINKRWTTKALLASTGTGSDYGYAGGQKMAADEEQTINEIEAKRAAAAAKIATSTTTTETKTDDTTTTKTDNTSAPNEDELLPRHVFDNITKKYKTVTGAVKIKSDESKVLPVGTNTTKAESKGVEFDIDEAAQDATPHKLSIDDKTDYNKTTTKNDTAKVSSEVSYSAVSASKDKQIIEMAATEVIVDMTPEDPSLIELSEKSYANIPAEKRGYSDMAQILDDIDLKSESVYMNLGPVIVANRLSKVQWSKGFIAGFNTCKALLHKEISDNANEKATIREKYIYILKTLVIIMANALRRNKALPIRKHDINETTREHLNTHPNFVSSDINDDTLGAIFNSHEATDLKEVTDIIRSASSNSN